MLQNSIRQEELLASWSCLPLVYHGKPGDLPHLHLLSKNNMGASHQAQGHTFLLKNQLIFKQKSLSLNLEADDKSTWLPLPHSPPLDSLHLTKFLKLPPV